MEKIRDRVFFMYGLFINILCFNERGLVVNYVDTEE